MLCQRARTKRREANPRTTGATRGTRESCRSEWLLMRVSILDLAAESLQKTRTTEVKMKKSERGERSDCETRVVGSFHQAAGAARPANHRALCNPGHTG